MSAGGLSYSAITNYGKTILPSVEGGFGSMNILRDPPRSITTRRVDRVGQTSLITDMVDESHTRACENIRQFALGVNPFVSVSYSSEGNNGGNRSNGFSSSNQGRQAFLPYTIMRDGAFRPPVMRQEQLMPLSRQPRVWTQVTTNPDFPDFSKRMRTCMENGREIRDDVLRVSARPTAVYTIEKPIEEPFEIKYVIQNPIRISGNSGIKTLDITEQKVQEPSQGHIHETNNASAFSNPSRNIQVTSIDEIMDMSNVRTKDNMNITYLTQLSGNDKYDYMHDDIELQRKMPEYEATTNRNMNIHRQAKYENEITLDRNIPNYEARTNTESRSTGGDDQITRQYRLNEKIFAGGMDGRAGVPTSERSSGVENVETRQSNIARLAMEMSMERYRR